MKPRIDMISGFLGAGKTTLILNMLQEIPAGEKLAICENEFGEAGIDGDALKGGDIEVAEVNAGCVCCTLAPGLIAGIKLLVARVRPTRILLEPTGLANLPDILNILGDAELADVVSVGAAAAVIDGGAMHANYVRYKGYFDAQIAAASVLFLNRTDGLGDDEKLALIDIIGGIHPGVYVAAEPFSPAAVWQALETPSVGGRAPYPGLPKSWLGQFQAFAVETGRRGSRERLESLPDNSAFGDIVRAKGFVRDGSGARWCASLSGGRMAFTPAGEGGPDTVQLIGRNLRKHLILDYFNVN